MPETTRELTVTRITLLELKDERRLVNEGYELLDEKRILLAAEIRRQMTRLRALRAECDSLENIAREKLEAAVSRYGLEELATYPPLTLADDSLRLQSSRLLGLELANARFIRATSPPRQQEPPVNPSPEARACALAHRQWLERAVELAACSVNLRRLLSEYQRTERRARAIENVLLPEIETSIAFIEEQLEGLDQEEVARLRLRKDRAP
jgi:V/A-type H+-transporting ATPase subunit D